MSDSLILDFPILRKDSNDFSEEISYDVEATRDNRYLHVEHHLKGHSFISNLIEKSKAKFSVRLLYKDSSERQYHRYDQQIPRIQNEAITIKQIIPVEFSYFPIIMPSIIVLEDVKITIDDSSGLTDFWKQGECFSIPQYARIALFPRLTFSDGSILSLMRLIYDESLDKGEMKVDVNEHIGEGEIPVSLQCSKDVYDQLRKVTQEKPGNIGESIGSAIVTQALCATYAYMQNLDSDSEVCSILSMHLNMLEEKTGLSWENEDFNPSLAATKMRPYVLNIFQEGTDDE